MTIKIYDYIFITNIPSFYKVNMYNALSKELDIMVVFISNKSIIRKDDFFDQEIKFDHVFINDGNFEKRNPLTTLFKAIYEIKKRKYKVLVFPGWEIKELLILACISPFKKNAVAIESSIIETKKTGFAWMLKKFFLKTMKIGLPSGELQNEILKLANFNGMVKFTHGVGVLNEIFYKTPKREYKSNNKIKYLYVGRLSPEKNLNFLCDAFADNVRYLTIAGYGPLLSDLEKKYNDRIHFLGEVSNRDLIKVYQEHDVLILPSTSEVWGLVIEEALCCGLAIIVSDKVGSKKDLVLSKRTGLEFASNNKDSLMEVLSEVENNFNYYFNNVKELELKDLQREKILPYVELINELKR